jgi:hypothetical protein
MTTENIIDTIWQLSKDLQGYYFSVNTKTIILFSEYVQFINVYLLLLVDGEINHLKLLKKIYPSHHLNKLIWSLMNVILAIVININNCYFGYLEQLENKMHLNVPKYNNNNNNDNNNNSKIWL